MYLKGATAPDAVVPAPTCQADNGARNKRSLRLPLTSHGASSRAAEVAPFHFGGPPGLCSQDHREGDEDGGDVSLDPCSGGWPYRCVAISMRRVMLSPALVSAHTATWLRRVPGLAEAAAPPGASSSLLQHQYSCFVL